MTKGDNVIIGPFQTTMDMDAQRVLEGVDRECDFLVCVSLDKDRTLHIASTTSALDEIITYLNIAIARLVRKADDNLS